MKKLTTLFILMIFTGACTVGPNYHRPKVDVPSTYRGTPPPQAAQPGPGPSQQGPQAAELSFGDQKWWEVFQDPQLQELIRTALKQNYDLRIAATRILEAQALVGIVRSGLFPTLNGGAAGAGDRFARQAPGGLAAGDRDRDRSGSPVLRRRGLPPALLREARRRGLRNDAALTALHQPSSSRR